MRSRADSGLCFERFRTANIMPLVVFQIFARAGVFEPSCVLHVPINRPANALLERDLRFPAEFPLHLGAIERVTAVMSRAILDILNQGIGFAQVSENRANDFEVWLGKASGNVVNSARLRFFKGQGNGTAIVLDEQPVTLLHSIPVDWEFFILAGIRDHKGDELLGELKWSVVVRAA